MRVVFYGHRNAGREIYPRLLVEVERHIAEFGVRNFFVGHYGAFDSMAARAVKEAKGQHSDVHLTMLLPYHPRPRPVKISAGFDGSYFPEGQEKVSRRLAIIRANEYMIYNTNYLICYVKHPSNGSREAMELALKREKRGLIRVTNLSGWYPET